LVLKSVTMNGVMTADARYLYGYRRKRGTLVASSELANADAEAGSE